MSEQVLWAHRTKTGRVIYDRKPHPFRYSDVERIARKFVQTTERPDMLTDQLLDLLIMLVRTIARRLGKGPEVLVELVIQWALRQQQSQEDVGEYKPESA